MIEWHAIAMRPGTRTRSGGGYLELWADPWIVERLPAVFATDDPAAVARALIAMIQLFEEVATETAEALELSYPLQAHAEIYRWAVATLSPLADDLDAMTNRARWSDRFLSPTTSTVRA